MRLAINGLRLTGPLTGVPRYLLNLLREWNVEPGPFDEIELLTHRQWTSSIPAGAIRQSVLRPRLPYSLAEQWLVSRAKADVLFCPANTMPVGYRNRCAVTVHDAMQELRPDWFGWWARWRYGPLYRYSAKAANIVLTDSESSKSDLLNVYGLPEKKVLVIPLAADPCFVPVEDPNAIAKARRETGIGDDPYVLFVGKLAHRRNIPLLMDAFAQTLRAANLPHRLLLVGVNHLNLPVATMARQAGLGDRWTHIEYVPDGLLRSLYSGADCFVYPSLYEGFGLPPLEAMSCGCPVVLFRNSSLIEVAGDAALFAESESLDGLTKALLSVLTLANLRRELSQRGLKQAARFSWRQTAAATLEALKEVAHGRLDNRL